MFTNNYKIDTNVFFINYTLGIYYVDLITLIHYCHYIANQLVFKINPV